MDSANVNKLISLGKRFLLPQLRKWWANRKKKKQQQQHQQQGGPSQSQYQQPQPNSYQYNNHNTGGQQYNGYPSSSNNYNNAQQQQQQGSYAGAASGYYGAEPNTFSGTGNNNYQGQQQQQQPYAQQPGYNNVNHQYGSSPSQQQHQYRPPHNVNSDMQNASNPEYIQLRNQALQEDDAMHKAFDEASRAYDQGDGARAKQLSNQGHAHQKNRDQLNDKAADWIFNSNNQNQPRGTIDLHGLYVQEAIEKTERAVQDAQSQGLPELRIITGKGIHSNQGVAKIKPAIEKLMVKYSLAAHLDPHNTGVLIVSLQGGGGGGSRDLGWVDQADRESDEGQCIVM